MAALVMAQAQAGEVLVSCTVVHLTTGSTIDYESLGELDLKGRPATTHSSRP